MVIHRRLHPTLLATLTLAICIVLVGCSNKEAEKTYIMSSPPPLFALPSSHSVAFPAITAKAQPTIQSTPTASILGSAYKSDIALSAKPVPIPLELRIPSLKVDAPMLAVGLTPDNSMDSPKGPFDDPLWHTAFWYRGGSIPGDVGTATIAGHVNDLIGRPEIFAHIKRLKPGDLVIIHEIGTSLDIRFKIDRVVTYSIQESSDPVVLSKIYGAGPVLGTGPQPAADGLSHLTLITCAGEYTDGHFDHHTVVYATKIIDVSD